MTRAVVMLAQRITRIVAQEDDTPPGEHPVESMLLLYRLLS
jgi:hypothetical protein